MHRSLLSRHGGCRPLLLSLSLDARPRPTRSPKDPRDGLCGTYGGSEQARLDFYVAPIVTAD